MEFQNVYRGGWIANVDDVNVVREYASGEQKVLAIAVSDIKIIYVGRVPHPFQHRRGIWIVGGYKDLR